MRMSVVTKMYKHGRTCASYAYSFFFFFFFFLGGGDVPSHCELASKC